MQYLKDRLLEKSTWVGFGAALTGTVAAVAALQLPQAVTVSMTAAIALCGVVAVLVPR